MIGFVSVAGDELLDESRRGVREFLGEKKTLGGSNDRE